MVACASALALAALAPGCESPGKSKAPAQARRNSAPKGIDASALAVGAVAPALNKIPTTRGEWSRGEKTTVLVFFRGHW